MAYQSLKLLKNSVFNDYKIRRFCNHPATFFLGHPVYINCIVMFYLDEGKFLAAQMTLPWRVVSMF